jgi:Secretion system C-terminal sorting domain
MQKFYIFILALTCSMVATAQCEVQLTFTIDGNTVTASVTGSGATTPSYAIEWGDGSQDLSSSATHTYVDGNYNICGAMFDSNNPLGCAVLDCYDIVIGQGGGGGCNVNFAPIVTGLNVGINATGSGAEAPVFTITWGDGTPEEVSAFGYHTYAEPGEYVICVIYADDIKGGCVIENCQSVTVTDLKTSCVVDIEVTSDPATGVASVVATGSGAENPQYIIAWGDGGLPAFGSTGTHTYAESGSYNLCVTYADANSPLACNVTECSTVDVTIGVEEQLSFDVAISVYPNPAQDYIIVEWKGAAAQDLSLQIIDMNGKIISSQYIGQIGAQKRLIPIQTIDLAKGVYVLRAVSSRGEQSVRLLK